jgi:ribosome-associated protein
MSALQELGEELAVQSREWLAKAPLPEQLRDAIEEVQSITDHEGRRRQMQYIGKLMRNIDADPIRAMLALNQNAARRAALHLHQVEQWRHKLLADDAAFVALGTVLGARLSAGQLAELRRVTALAREERGTQRAPHHYRDLFRRLNALFTSREASA